MQADEVHAVGTLDGKPWFGSGYFCRAGEPPIGRGVTEQEEF